MSPLLSRGQMFRLEGFRSLAFLSALYRPLIWKGTDGCAPLAGWSAAAQVRELGTERLRIVMGIFRESAVHSRSSLYSLVPIAMAVFSNKQCVIATLVLILCNFQSNSPDTCLPAFHKGNHSIGNNRALRVCFLFGIQHRLAKATWCIPMVTLTATAHTPRAWKKRCYKMGGLLHSSATSFAAGEIQPLRNNTRERSDEQAARD